MAKKAAKPEFGSKEHLDQLVELHYGFRPWKVSIERKELEDMQRCVMLSDKKRGVPTRQTQICQLNDGSEGFGIFFMRLVTKS